MGNLIIVFTTMAKITTTYINNNWNKHDVDTIIIIDKSVCVLPMEATTTKEKLIIESIASVTTISTGIL